MDQALLLFDFEALALFLLKVALLLDLLVDGLQSVQPVYVL